MAGASKKENWASHNGACTSCRTRKIRCGREKPQCSCCRRDQVECVYSSPPKRVNHVKVLCQSFDDIQDRLVSMQGELTWLTSNLRRPNAPGQLGFDPDKTTQSADSSPRVQSRESSVPPPSAGHVVRDGGTQIERYYGPWTLVAQCRDFELDLLSHLIGTKEETFASLVKDMLHDAVRTDNDNIDLETRSRQHNAVVCLPPRQLLSVMLDTFLKQADYSTDIFCRHTIYDAVDRVYREPYSAKSEPWALCFNLIILLTLGAEHPIHSEDPFVQPMLQAAHATARKPMFFMSPRLVNIQALALFSLLAQQYQTDTETLSDSIFAQACVLAREAGLHHASVGQASSSNLSSDEMEERKKVYGSLFIRDRYSAIASGNATWLPGTGARVLSSTSSSVAGSRAGSPPDQDKGKSWPHFELAKIQDDLDRLLVSVEASQLPSSDHQAALSRLQQRLERWTQTCKVPCATRPTTLDDISLHLAFLGTRVRILHSRTSLQPNSTQVLDDARLSCLLVATACTPLPSQALADHLDRLLTSGTGQPSHGETTSHSCSSSSSPTEASSPSSNTSFSEIDAHHRTAPSTPSFSNLSLDHASAVTPLPLHRLASVFPTAAIFVLARNILGLQTNRQDTTASSAAKDDDCDEDEKRQDIALLQALLFCFRSAPAPAATTVRGKADTYIHGSKLGRIIQHLVDIIHAITNRSAPHDYHMDDATAPPLATTVDNDDHSLNIDMYAPDETLGPASSLLLDPSHHSLSMPNLSLYGAAPPDDSIPPTHFGIPPAGTTTSALASAWAVAGRQDSSLSSSSGATPLLTHNPSSLYAQSTTATPSSSIPDTTFDISQFLNQMGNAGSPMIWDGGAMDCQMGPAQTQQQQTQCMPDLSSNTTPTISTSTGKGPNNSINNNNGLAATSAQSDPPKRRARKRTRVEGSPH